MSAAADDVARSRELTTEEHDAWRRRANAMELELKEKLRAELDNSKGAEAKVTETWRKVLRLAKVRPRRRCARCAIAPPPCFSPAYYPPFYLSLPRAPDDVAARGHRHRLGGLRPRH